MLREKIERLDKPSMLHQGTITKRRDLQQDLHI